ncbi:BglG family transcription antiterminator [Fusobacterium sp.]|uniref:BglG family transcription antiterminator n=1 Tax=Fusobacterium sp. TaxID=68766 RepID=UPI002624EEB7|nr:BglG family transcription antiterminator [Fusobacterium sp.]
MSFLFTKKWKREGKIMLGSKSIIILQILYNTDEEKNLKELAEILNFSERSLRYEIEKIFETLDVKELGLELSKGSLKIGNKKKLLEILEKNYKSSNFSSEEREIYITLKILFERIINQVHLAEELDVSRSTIKLHLKKIEEILKEYNLKLEISHKKGLEIIGEEEKIRLCALKLIRKINHSKNELFKKVMRNYFDLNEEGIVIFINYCQKIMNKIISDEAFEIIKKYLKISLLMVKKGYELKKIKNEKFLEETLEYKAVEKGKALLEANYEIEMGKVEYLKIADYFLGSHNYNLECSYFENWVEIELLIKKMIYNFNKRIDIDISNDEVLLDGLINHIKPTIYRIKNGIELENTIYEEVVEIYPHLFEITKEILEELEEFIQNKFSKDEIAFIVIHFRAAIDRNKVRSKEKKNILVICGWGYGTSKLLAQQLKDIYSVNIIDILPYHQYKKKKYYKDIDLVVSTVELKELDEGIPVIKVNPILTNEDLQKLNKQDLQKSSKKVLFSEVLEAVKKVTTNLDEKMLLKELNGVLGNILVDDISQKKITIFDMLDKNLILDGIEVNNWEEAVRKAGENLVKYGYSTEKYVDNMVESIKKYGSYAIILPGIAFPHAKSEGEVVKTAFSIVRLKKEVLFPGDIPVKMIVAFSSIDNKEHLDAFIEIVEMMEKKDFDFIKFVKKYCKK